MKKMLQRPFAAAPKKRRTIKTRREALEQETQPSVPAHKHTSPLQPLKNEIGEPISLDRAPFEKKSGRDAARQRNWENEQNGTTAPQRGHARIERPGKASRNPVGIFGMESNGVVTGELARRLTAQAETPSAFAAGFPQERSCSRVI
jgi:hypothetical protein